MTVRVEYTGQVRAAAGRHGDEVEVDAGTSLGGLVGTLAALGPPALRPHLVTADGRIQPTLVVVVDGRAVAGDAREAVVIGDHATVVFLPPVAGG